MDRLTFITIASTVTLTGCVKHASTKSASGAKPLGAFDPDKLLSVAKDLVTNHIDDYRPVGENTQCSKLVRDWFHGVTGNDSPELVGQADAQYCALSTSGNWSQLTGDLQPVYDSATTLAKAGTVVVAVWQNPADANCPPTDPNVHGHIVAVMPLDQQLGYDQKFNVPLVAQATKIIPNCTVTGVEWNSKLSCAFGQDKQTGTKFFKYTA